MKFKTICITSLFAGILLAASSCGSGAQGINTNPNNELMGVPEVDAITEKILQSPNDTTLYIARYKALMNIEEFERAIRDAEKLRQLDSNNLAYYRFLANAYFDNNQSLPAIKTLESAIAKHPNDIYTKLSLAEMHLIVEAHDQSLVILDNLLKDNPYNTQIMYMRGLVLKDRKDTMQALQAFQNVVQQDADHLEAYLQLSELSDALNNPIALQYIDNALRIDSVNQVALMKKAQYFHQRGKLDEAIVWYQKNIEAHPLVAEPAYNLGLLYLEQGDATKDKKKYELAHKYFHIATQNDVQFGEAYYYRGLASEKLGKINEARQDYENAIAMGEQLGLAEKALEQLNKK